MEVPKYMGSQMLNSNAQTKTRASAQTVKERGKKGTSMQINAISSRGLHGVSEDMKLHTIGGQRTADRAPAFFEPTAKEIQSSVCIEINQIQLP